MKYGVGEEARKGKIGWKLGKKARRGAVQCQATVSRLSKTIGLLSIPC
jgi:hypothetical protein